MAETLTRVRPQSKELKADFKQSPAERRVTP